MSILTKDTPLKVWHLIVAILIISIIYFAYSTWRQVNRNTANITTIIKIINQAQLQQPIVPEKEK